MSEAPRVPALGPGDRVPNLTLPDIKGRTRRLYLEVGGGPIVIATAPNPLDGPGREVLDGLARRAPALDRIGAHRFVLTRRAPEPGGDTGALSLIDPYGDAMSLFLPPVDGGGQSAASAAVLDPNQRVVAVFPAEVSGDPAAQAVRLAERLAALMAAGAADLDRAAPALLLARLLPVDLCERLAALGPDRPVSEADLKREVAVRLGARLGTEIRRTFQFRPVLRFEPFRIFDAGAAADARRGAAEDDKRSRFVVLVGLTAGGDRRPGVVFPEYGPHAYRLGQGSAIAFSCELLFRTVADGVAPMLATVLAEPASG